MAENSIELVRHIHFEILKLKNEGRVIEKGSIKIEPKILRIIFTEYVRRWEEEISLFDWSKVSFENVDVCHKNLSGTNIILDPQVIKDRTLWGTNCYGLDMSGEDFTGVNIIGANLEGTRAKIDPQKVASKFLVGTNCRGLDMKGKNFTGVC